MSPRDRLPYADHTGRLPDGTALFSIQNLIAEDLELFADTLTTRLAVLRMHGADKEAPAALLEGLEARAERMDQLIRACRYIAQG